MVNSCSIVGRQQAPLQGRAYCFLPIMAIATGLPMHVNGYFELSSNRRSLWWMDGVAHNEDDPRAQWNASLLTQGVAVVIARVLSHATTVCWCLAHVCVHNPVFCACLMYLCDLPRHP